MPTKPAAKDKVVSVKGDEAEELVLQYLKQVNRPYASTDVSANLKNKVSKANAQKVLACLAEKGSLTMKMYGKQSVFVYNQNELDTLAPEALAEVETEIKGVMDDVEALRKKLRGLTAELTITLAQPKTQDLQDAIDKLEHENEVSVAHLEPLRAAARNAQSEDPSSSADVMPGGPISSAEIALVDQDWTRWRKEWVDRRKVYMRGIDALKPDAGRAERAEYEESEGVEQDTQAAVVLEQSELCKPVQIIRKASIMDSGKVKVTPSAPGEKVSIAGDKRKRS